MQGGGEKLDTGRDPGNSMGAETTHSLAPVVFETREASVATGLSKAGLPQTMSLACWKKVIGWSGELVDGVGVGVRLGSRSRLLD